MAKEYVVGIDIGTTGAKTAIYDIKGNVVGTGYREYSCQYPKPNWVEQDVSFTTNMAMESAKEAVTTSGVSPGNIASIGLSAQRCCTIFIDKSGNPLRPMISWQDNRTSIEVEEIKKKISARDFYQATGLPMNTTWILTKIYWVRKKEPHIWQNVYKVIQNHDYALKALGAEDYYVDVPDAVFYGVWDTNKFQWSNELLELFEIDKNILPKPIPSGTKVGVISKEAAELTGFLQGTPLCVGAGDQNSAVVGAGIVFEGTVSVSIGTGGIAIAYLDKPFRDPNEMSMVTNHAVYGKWQLEGYQAGAASVFRWFRDEIATLEKSFANGHKVDVYKILNELIDRTPAGAKGLVILPYFASATAPRWNPDARGTILGLTFAHDRACLARAFIEGVTLEEKDIITSMLKSGIKIKTIRIIGGATKSKVWNQIQADMYKKPVETLRVTDAAVLGAAILGGVGVGLFKDIKDGVKKMVTVDQRYEPNSENSKIYDELYDIYCNAYEGLNERKVFSKLAKIQEKN